MALAEAEIKSLLKQELLRRRAEAQPQGTQRLIEALERKLAPSPGLLKSFGSGAARGFKGLLEIATAVPEPIATINPLARLAQEYLSKPAIEAVGNIPTVEPQTTAEKAVERAGQSIGASIIPIPGLALPSLAGGAVGGAAAGLTQALGGGPGAQALAELAAPTGPALAASGARRLVRGGAAGQQAIQQAIQEAGQAGTFPTVGQALATGVGPQGAQAKAAALTEGALSRVPFGASGRMQRVAEQQAEDVGSTLERLVSSLGRGTPDDAGRALERGLGDEGFLARFRGKTEQLANRFAQQVPQDTPVEINKTKELLAELTPRFETAPGFESLVSSPLIRQTREALQNVNQVPFQELRLIRSGIGRRLSSPSLVDDIPRGDLKRLYGALSEDLKGAAKRAGPQAEKAFDAQNKFYRQGLKRIDDFIEPLLRKKTPEQVFESLLPTSGKINVSKVRQIRSSLKPAQWDAVVSATLARMGRQVPSGPGPGQPLGDFNIESFLTAWNKLGPKGRQALLSGKRYGGLAKDLEAVANTAERVRALNAATRNPSGTAQALAQSAAIGGGGAAAFLYAPWLTTASIAASYSLSRLMTSPTFVKWLARSGRLPVAQIPAALTRLANSVRSDDELQNDVAGYIADVQSRLTQ